MDRDSVTGGGPPTLRAFFFFPKLDIGVYVCVLCMAKPLGLPA